MTATLQILQAARERLTPKGAWCRGAYMRDADGKEPGERGFGTPVCWCPLTAIRLAAARFGGDPLNAERALALELPGERWLRSQPGTAVVEWNDHRSRQHRHVLAAFDRAIARKERTT